MARALLLISIFLVLFFFGCDGEKMQESNNPCEGVTCSGRGVCVVNNNEPSCICKEGYESSGLKCIKIVSDTSIDSFLDDNEIPEDVSEDIFPAEDISELYDVIVITDIYKRDIDEIQDSEKSCNDQCEKPDSRICEDNQSFKICKDYNLDGCYEWGEALKCPSNSICKDGYCDCGNNFMDCNGADYDGCEANILEDIYNCGRCGNYCQFDNSIVECKNGVCTIKQCNPGWGDCNEIIEDGCESNLWYDNNNCGICKNSCGYQAVCNMGKCVCNYGFADCNQTQADGCETRILSDNNNCGRCNNKCGPNSICISGECICKDNWGDCNNNKSDGCETNLTSNNEHCGSCNNRCGSHSYCDQGFCRCDEGWGNCNNDFYDGCETELLNNINNCGACYNKCNKNATCEKGQCKCTYGWGNCNGTWADGCELDILHDNNNCGACFNSCGYKAWCNNGQCVCEWNYGNCNGIWNDGCEVDLNSNNNHCGQCWNGCGQHSFCVNAQCICEDCYANCDAYPGCETMICYDPYHCGSCNRVCNPDEYCNYKSCVK